MRIILGANRIAPQPIFLAAMFALLLIGCTSLGPNKDWQADGFDQRTRITLAQIGLRSEGFDTGPVDGQEGAQTQAAATAFRRAIGLSLEADIDAALVETIFHDHDLTKPMPYLEGSFRNCFRWGPHRVIIMASNLGTLTCTVAAGKEVKPKEIALAETFCRKSVPLQSDAVKCELIYDGRRIVNHQRLTQLSTDPSPDLPILLRSQELEKNVDSTTHATLQSEAPLYQFHQSVYNLDPPNLLKTPLHARIIGVRGRTICEGTVVPIDYDVTSYEMVCFSNTPMRGEARFVGVVPVGELLLPAYETTAHYSNFRMSIIPPDNLIRFEIPRR